jgi:hypothetical protein
MTDESITGTLLNYAESGMIGLDHALPPGVTHRPKAFAKKYRSTVSWPMFSCSSLIRFSSAARERAVLEEKSSAMLNVACRFQLAIMLGWTHTGCSVLTGSALP